MSIENAKPTAFLALTIYDVNAVHFDGITLLRVMRKFILSQVAVNGADIIAHLFNQVCFIFLT